jgi:hypothetical protein
MLTPQLLILGVPLKIYVQKPLFLSREIDNHVWFDVCTTTATITGAVAGAESTTPPRKTTFPNEGSFPAIQNHELAEVSFRNLGNASAMHLPVLSKPLSMNVPQ